MEVHTKLTNEELGLIQQMNSDYSKMKLAIADAEIQKESLLRSMEQLRSDFANHEKLLIDKYGSDAVINMQTGEVTKKENGKD
jgi:hypothetical protein